MVTSFKRTYATCYGFQDCCCQSSYSCSRPLLTHAPTGDPPTHRQVGLSLLWGQCSFPWVLLCIRFCLCPPSVSGGYEFDFQCDCTPLVATSPLSLEGGYLFLMGSNILLLMAVKQLVAILVFSLEKISAHPFTPPS